MDIETQRCLIRRFTPEDAAALHAVLSDEAVMQYIEAPFSYSQTQAFIREAGLCHPPLVYALLWKETERVIGHVIFHPVQKNEWEIGWILSRSYWGMGIASECTAALVARSRALGAASCLIECHPAQTATARIARKHSFGYAGTSDGCDVYRLIF